MLQQHEDAGSAQPVVTPPIKRELSTTIPKGADLTAYHTIRMSRRAKERRRVTRQALALRVAAVGRAWNEGDRTATCGELDNLASAALAASRYMRSTGRLY